MSQPTADPDSREEQVHGNSGPGGPLRWLAREWDFLLIASAGLAVGGIISTVDAVQRAAVYH